MSRRVCVRSLVALSVLLASSRDCNGASVAPRTILNGVLSGYGIPTLSDVGGYSSMLEQYGNTVVQFIYPKAWVLARAEIGRSGQGRTGLSVGDYRRAEGLALFSMYVGEGVRAREVDGMDIARLVTPGDVTSMDPDVSVVRDVVRDDGYRVIDTVYESTTASGYTVERRGTTCAVVLSDGTLYALSGNCSSNRWKVARELFANCIDSFQVYRL